MLRLKILCFLILSLISTNSFGQWIILREEVNEELLCMAKNIYFESGNQPLAGKLAVGFVTINRVVSSLFPESICDVIYQSEYYTNNIGEEAPVIGRCQFSWYCDGKSDKPTDSYTWLQALEISREILDFNVLDITSGIIDITEGSLWYHADYANPYWSQHLQKTVTIENHIFYK